MNKMLYYIKSKIRRLRYQLKHDYLTIDKVVFVIAIIFCGAWTWGAISSMSRNWELEQRVDASKKELTLLQLETQTLELENQYYQSEEYQELATRAKQNKKLPGEFLVYLPANSHSARDKYKTDIIPEDQATPSNFEQWMSFLFGS